VLFYPFLDKKNEEFYLIFEGIERILILVDKSKGEQAREKKENPTWYASPHLLFIWL
jgi:hypothetical protein